MRASLPVLIVSVFLSAVLTTSATEKTEKDDSAKLPLKKRAAVATKYQTTFKKQISDQLTKLENPKLTPLEFAAEMQKYNDIMMNYVNSINGMKFPCSSTAEAKKTKGYIAWFRKFAAKDKKIKDESFARLKMAMKKAGFK